MSLSVLRRLKRRPHVDFSDYLELRRLRDAGHDEVRAMLATVEHALGVGFGDRIPHLVSLADAPAPPPRGLTREALRVMFAMREEFAAHGRARATMTMGFELPDGEGLKDWLDFIENERKQAMRAREALRELDRRIWAVYTGERRMPSATLP